MIATITLNPCLDRTITVCGLKVDEVNRWTSARLFAGGKGIDVSRAIHGTGGRTMAYGFIGGPAGRTVEILLDEEGVPFSFTPIGQETRTNFIIADTKMEFGLDEDRLLLIDELLTPDSSRIWDIALYKVGQSQPSYDKQPVRDWLVESGWNKEPPAPMLPPEVIGATTRRYEQAYERLTGKKLIPPDQL